MRSTRASRSVNLRLTGSSAGVSELQPTAAMAMTIGVSRSLTGASFRPERGGRTRRSPARSTIDELDAPVQTPRFLVASGRRRPLLTVAHGADLIRGCALQHE